MNYCLYYVMIPFRYTLGDIHHHYSLLQIDRKMISLGIRFLRARTPEQRAAVDLDTHYTKVIWNNILNSRYKFGLSLYLWVMLEEEIDFMFACLSLLELFIENGFYPVILNFHKCQ